MVKPAGPVPYAPASPVPAKQDRLAVAQLPERLKEECGLAASTTEIYQPRKHSAGGPSSSGLRIGGRSWPTVRGTRSQLFGIAVGFAALGLTWAAHVNGRPIAAAILAVFGVMGVGALLGARAGLFAGIAASLTFNLAFTDPTWTFTYSTADDLVPMIALTLSAVGSGVVAGRLRDRAVAAETATRRVAVLLRFSEDLQSAVTLADVDRVARCYLVGDEGNAWLFTEEDGKLVSHSAGPEGAEAARECWISRFPSLTCGDCTGYLLRSAERRLGVLVVEQEAGRSADEIRLFLPLISLAIQRCQLAEQLGKADLLRRSEQFKTALLSSVSHDLRTPLAAISASAGSLIELRAKLDERTTAELLTTIQEQCGRLDRFTRNLLNLGRIEGGLDVASMPPVDALEVLGGTLARVRDAAGGHAIHRHFGVQSALVRADEALLEQLFLNILENAVAHTPAGTSVRVSADRRGSDLVVAVEDDGQGIPEPERERVFERFHQVMLDGAPPSGSGLGLSIAKGFTESFGGTIAALPADQPLRGARIEVRLPLAEAA